MKKPVRYPKISAAVKAAFQDPRRIEANRRHVKSLWVEGGVLRSVEVAAKRKATRIKNGNDFMPRVVRKRLSKRLRSRYRKDPKFKSRHLAAARSPIRNAKISAAAKLRWADPVLRAKYLACKPKRVVTDKQRAAISKRLKGYKRPPRTLEHCLNLSKSLRKPSTRLLLANKAANTRARLSRPNGCEKALWRLLKGNFPGKFKLNIKGGLVVGGKLPDFVSRHSRVVIELFGNYWHGPLITGQSRQAEEKERIKHFRDHGYKAIVIWESELSDTVKVVRKVRSQL